jgi:NitT/TauT family transport system permease protein
VSLSETATPTEPITALHDDVVVGREVGVRWVRTVLPPVVGVALFLGLWQAAVWVFDIPDYELPAPSSVLSHIASDPSYYWENSLITMKEAFLGFVMALALALAAATVMAHSRFVEQAALPLVVLIQVTPIIAYAPAVVIWLGFGLKPILVITALVCFVPFLVNAVTGFRSVDPATHELMRSVGASSREVFLRLRFPHALPYLFSAARIAVGLALIGAVLGEFFAGVTGGLGYSVKLAQSRNLVLQLWGSIFVLGFIGAVAVLAISGLERIVLRWHSSQAQQD